MMLFIHTLDKVLSGEKTQTRRIVKPTDTTLNYWRNPIKTLDDPIGVVRRGGRDMWMVTKDYAVCPARGKAQVARIMIKEIRRVDVRDIVVEDAIAEGFVSGTHFMLLWTKMHDTEHYSRYPTTGQQSLAWDNGVLWGRPAERYQAWALTFVKLPDWAVDTATGEQPTRE